MSQYRCPTCTAARRGVFEDADTESGIVIPLCPTCLGTGISSRDPEFEKLKVEADAFRTFSYDLQLGDLAGNTSVDELNKLLYMINDRFVELARRAVELVKPNKKCYALELLKDHE